MTTGLIGTLTASSSLTYTPVSNSKMSVSAVGGAASINGVNAVAAGTQGYFYVGAGQAVVIATGSATTAIVSAVEENS